MQIAHNANSLNVTSGVACFMWIRYVTLFKGKYLKRAFARQMKVNCAL